MSLLEYRVKQGGMTLTLCTLAPKSNHLLPRGLRLLLIVIIIPVASTQPRRIIRLFR